MKIALGQLNIAQSCPSVNAEQIKKSIALGYKQKVDILIFPALAISGEHVGDAWLSNTFINDCIKQGKKIIDFTQKYAKMTVIFGNIAYINGKLYSAIYIAQKGRLLNSEGAFDNFWLKSNQPYSKYFSQIDERESVCADLNYNPINIGTQQEPFKVVPLSSDLTVRKESDLIICVSYDSFSQRNAIEKQENLKQIAKESKKPLAYVNNVGISNEGTPIYVYSGGSVVINNMGEIVFALPDYTAIQQEVDLDQINSMPNIEIKSKNKSIDQIYRAIIAGIRQFTNRTVKKAVIGLSGGIDSAIAAALYCLAIGRENVLGINLPGAHTSVTTKNLAYILAKNLGINYAVQSIEKQVKLTQKEVFTAPITNLGKFSNAKNGEDQESNYTYLKSNPLWEENIQARSRSTVFLAGYAAAWGGGFTCNANKCELSAGYTTMYGDGSGFLAATADLWKYQIYELANYINKEIFDAEMIPQGSIDIVPSAELSADQNVDKGQGDPLHYPYHDYLFAGFVEKQYRPEDILNFYQQKTISEMLGCKPEIIEELFPEAKLFVKDLEFWWQQYTINSFKRVQAPPVIALTSFPFGDKLEPQIKSYLSADYLEIKKYILDK